ncbi:cytochrome c3 family protein, partial [Bradyrhizobium sp. HKCCYLRH3073]|uniref:cytochrome c3 family protein n=2 Tax=unclassified Bradyrhizobium TaxID=2631580 RepID=UPI003EC038A9
MSSCYSRLGLLARASHRMVQWLLACVLLTLVLAGHAAAQSSFDHVSTGFPLTGSHVGVECSSCHVGGRFKGTQTQCASCHNGAQTAGMSVNHPITTRRCESCHQTSTWKDVRAIDHTQAKASCTTCHNGVMARGKSKNHITTAAPCDVCHRSTASFRIRMKMDHAGIVAGCANCHNGTTARGKSSNHLQTNLPCESCHTSTASFGGAAFKHAATDTNCATCHNGKTAQGMTTPPHIPTGMLQCSNCHSNTAASFATYTMNHAAVATARCDSCHNGSYTGQGTKGALGTASYPNHVATGGADCVSCHSKAASGGFISWGGAAFKHAATDTSCATCHNGKTAQGMTTPPHIPTGTLQCSNCHSNTAASFTTYTMNHAAVATARCDSCHNGSYTGQGTKGAMSTASYPNHVATGGADCVSCHAKAASGGFTSWGGAAFAHKATDTNCSTCHNGKTALGMTT